MMCRFLVLIYFYCAFIVLVCNHIIIREMHFQICRDIFPILFDIIPILIFFEVIAEQLVAFTLANIFLRKKYGVALIIFIPIRNNDICNRHVFLGWRTFRLNFSFSFNIPEAVSVTALELFRCGITIITTIIIIVMGNFKIHQDNIIQPLDIDTCILWNYFTIIIWHYRIFH